VAKLTSRALRIVDRIHEDHVFDRRVRRLVEHLAATIPRQARVLDVGCGSGQIASMLMEQRPDLRISGIDVLVRPHTDIPVQFFDGSTIPYPDGAFDVVMFVDVLHHTDDPLVLLREANRVASQAIVIKDHTRNGFLANPTLRFMDHVGNARHDVVLPYNYWPKQRWLDAFDRLGWTMAQWCGRLDLYGWPADWIFGRSLHFVARLEKR
jgi:SAM-dependent methyltransferase